MRTTYQARKALMFNPNRFFRIVLIAIVFGALIGLGSVLRSVRAEDQPRSESSQPAAIVPIQSSALFRLKDDDEVIGTNYFRQFTDQKSFLSYHYQKIAKQSLRKDQIDVAIAHYRRAIELTPARSDLHFELGLRSARIGKIDSAMNAFHFAVKLDPNIPNVMIIWRVRWQMRENSTKRSSSSAARSISIHKMPKLICI